MIDKNNPKYFRLFKKMTKVHCKGCEDNFYNGNNPFNIEECWHFPKAIIIMRKEVSVDQCPPWTQKPKLFPSCYTKKRYVYVDPNRVN